MGGINYSGVDKNSRQDDAFRWSHFRKCASSSSSSSLSQISDGSTGPNNNVNSVELVFFGLNLIYWRCGVPVSLFFWPK